MYTLMTAPDRAPIVCSINSEKYLDLLMAGYAEQHFGPCKEMLNMLDDQPNI